MLLNAHTGEWLNRCQLSITGDLARLPISACVKTGWIETILSIDNDG
jgi:hypothetical protein